MAVLRSTPYLPQRTQRFQNAKALVRLLRFSQEWPLFNTERPNLFEMAFMPERKNSKGFVLFAFFVVK
jgi:hypothetical protein